MRTPSEAVISGFAEGGVRQVRVGSPTWLMGGVAVPFEWELQFSASGIVHGTRCEALTVVDPPSRCVMAVDFADRITATRVINFLEITVKRLGKPTFINCDRGEPLQIPALIEWCRNAGITVHFRPPGPP